MNDDKLLTPQELAEILQVHMLTVLRWAQKGKIPHYRWDKGTRFILREVLESMKYPANNEDKNEAK